MKSVFRTLPLHLQRRWEEESEAIGWGDLTVNHVNLTGYLGRKAIVDGSGFGFLALDSGGPATSSSSQLQYG